MKEGDFTIIGLGLIGGSIGACLRANGARVRGFDRSASHARLAQRRGLVDQVAATLESAVAGADTVILATPVLNIIELLPSIDAVAGYDALVLDTGSVKGPIVKGMASLPGAGRAVGGHPLAGDERAGPQAANPDLFAGKTFVLCPSLRSSSDAMDRARSVVERLGAIPIVMDADRHDRVLARTSHLPQFLSSALALSLQPGDESFAGPGLREMTRLAASDALMWSDIAHTNRTNIVQAIREYGQKLDELARLVESRDASALKTAMRQGAAALEQLRAGAMA